MDFKIQQTYPTPSQGISSFNTLTYLHSINSLAVYGLQKLSAEPQAEQPKKKISFKASKDPAPASLDKISIYSLQNRSWNVIEAKGKIPTPREDFCAFQIAKCLILVGGKSNGKYLNEVVAFNTQTNMWKKLFSLEGPPATKDPIVIKTSSTSACLFSGGSLWSLQLGDVKWQLSANQLPGSVWQKLDIELPSQILFLWQISSTQILLVSMQSVTVINIELKQKSRSFNFDGKKIKCSEQRMKVINLCEQKGGFYSLRVGIAFENKMQILQYENEGNQQIKVLNIVTENDQESSVIQLQKKIHCLTSTDSDTVYYLDPKGQLISINFQFPHQDTTRLIVANKDQNKDEGIGGGKIGDYDFQNCIEEEEELDQSSTYLMHNSDSQVRLPVHDIRIGSSSEEEDKDDRKALMRSHESPISNKHQQKNKIINPYQKSNNKMSEMNQDNSESQLKIDYEQTQSQNSFLLKNKLGTILTHQHLKRRLLEEKAEALERTIKKSQKFVFLLCKYSDQRDKLKHIEKVKQLRQELQLSWGKQTYFRKQMQNDRIPIKIRNLVQKVLIDSKQDQEQFDRE